MIFPVILQTVINLRMLSIRGQQGTELAGDVYDKILSCLFPGLILFL